MDFLTPDWLGKPAWMWLGFMGVVPPVGAEAAQ